MGIQLIMGRCLPVHCGTAKAVIRGKLIMCSACKKKEKEKQINDLTVTLKSLENKHINYNDDNILKQIQNTKQILDNVYESQLEIKAKFLKLNFYENGPKS